MGKKQASVGTLTVPGEGRVMAKPDIAQLRLGVLTEAKTAGDAVGENASAMSQVIEAITDLDVATDALKTVGLNIYPVIRFQEAADRNEIVAFRAENTILAELPVERAGEVFDAAVKAGANESSSISFAVRDEAPLRRKALEAAVKSAKTDAQIVAKAMGVDLAGIKSIDVEQGGGPVLVRTAARFEQAASTPVLGGDVSISARINVVFEVVS